MSTISGLGQGVKITTSAPKQFDVQPVPDWVRPKSVNFDFRRDGAGGNIWLLWDKQIHAEHRQCYHHQAVRVQGTLGDEFSTSWRIDVTSVTAHVIWHSVKVIRGGKVVENVDPASAKIARQTGKADVFSLGQFTILVPLKSLRAGDVVEAVYSTDFLPDFLDDRCSDLVIRPEGMAFGIFGYTVFFVEPRPLAWKASSPDLLPVESRENGQTQWSWLFENTSSPKAESHSPGWHVSSLWIQISDVADWQILAEGIANLWKPTPGDASLTAMGWDISTAGGDSCEQVTKALNLIQDEFRGEAANGISCIPAAAGEVIRRRQGDGKELAFLLTQLLKKIGVESRLILVNPVLKKELSGFLPSLSLLTHAIVEFQIGKELRWVDPSTKFQGGDALNRTRPSYGVGLPIERESPGLIKAPEGGRLDDTWSLHETILLSTNGASSMVGVVLRAKGRQADWHREQLATQGLDAISGQRLREFSARYGADASRVDPLQYRDSREANELVMAESFEVMLNLTPKGDGRLSLAVPGNLATSTLPVPDDGVRRGAFILPFPMEASHTIEIRSEGCLKKQAERRGQVGAYLNSVSSFRFLSGTWSMTCTTSTHSALVPAKDIERYKETLQNVGKDTVWNATVLADLPRPHRQKGFGSLPPERLRGSATEQPLMPERDRPVKRRSQGGTKITLPLLRSSSYTREDLKDNRRMHRKNALKPASTWLGILIIFIAGCVVLHYRGR